MYKTISVIVVALCIVYFYFYKRTKNDHTKILTYNSETVWLKTGEHTLIKDCLKSTIIFGFTVSDNRAKKISLVTSTWDTMFVFSSGVPVTYSYRKLIYQNTLQITNISNNWGDSIGVSCFSAKHKATIQVEGSEQLIFHQNQSLKYNSKQVSTIRMNSLNNNSILVYAVFASDSIVPVVLNTSDSVFVQPYQNIPNIKYTPGNTYEFRGRWTHKQLFFICLPIVPDSVRMEFFPG